MRKLGLAGVLVLALVLLIVGVAAASGTGGAVAQSAGHCPFGVAFDPDMRALECLLPTAGDAMVATQPVARAQSGSPYCPWGYAVDPATMALTCISGSDELVLVGSKPVTAAQDASTCTSWTSNNPMLYGYVQDCGSIPSSVAKAEPKVAGLASINPVAKPGASTCLYGDAYDPLLLGPVEGCPNGSIVIVAPDPAAARPAGLASINAVSVAQEIAARCPWGGYPDSRGGGFICNSNPASTGQVAGELAAKPVGLASINPVTRPPAQAAPEDAFDCPAGAAYNPDMRGIQCLLAPSAEVTAAKLVTVVRNTTTNCAEWTANNPMLYGYVQDCGSGYSTIVEADSKVAGLASMDPVAPAGGLSSCGDPWIVEIDPLAFPLACQQK